MADEGPGHAVEDFAQHDVAADSWASVGETADPEGREHVRVEIVTSE
ncbi:hypothetical protein [Streptomyces sp. NPDC048142]